MPGFREHLILRLNAIIELLPGLSVLLKVQTDSFEARIKYIANQ